MKYNESKTKDHKYIGWFFKHPEKEFYRWNDFIELCRQEDMKKNAEEEAKFQSFCSRMWLDNCDENLSFGSERHTFEEYTSKYKDYLLERYKERNGYS